MRETHAAKILVQQFDISVDDLEGDQFILLVFHSTAEVQAGISGKKTHFKCCF